MLLRRLRGLSAVVSGRLRCGLSTAASRPPWAMIGGTLLLMSPALRASFHLVEPPRASHLLVPVHLVDPRPGTDPDGDIVETLNGTACATSGDGLLLLVFFHGRFTAPVVTTPGGTREHKLTGLDLDPDVTRFVCNPITGQLFRLPDIDGTKKTVTCHNVGLLTRSTHGYGLPDRYAVAELSMDLGAEERSFVMRRFLSQSGEWDKLVGLPSPLPLARRMDIHHEVVAFAGRLWWVDLAWGAISADPFSDQPDLRFVELPTGSVLPVPGTLAEKVAARRMQGVYRRIGVSEGRLRYAEVSQEEPFLLSSFSLDDDGTCWTLEHRVALGRLWANGAHPSQEDMPQIGVIDPLNASVMYLTIGRNVLAVDMDMGNVLACSPIGEGEDRDLSSFCSTFLRPCVLPQWLGSSRIPSAGDKANIESKMLSDILVRVDRDKKN